MYSTNYPAFLVIQAALALFFLASIAMDVFGFFKARNGASKLTVTRGDKSMAMLYTVYASTLACLYLLVSEISCLESNRVAIISANFLMTTYLFMFSAWFRNSVFFRLAERIKEN